jgi:hypothetical protein
MIWLVVVARRMPDSEALSPGRTNPIVYQPLASGRRGDLTVAEQRYVVSMFGKVSNWMHTLPISACD